MAETLGETKEKQPIFVSMKFQNKDGIVDVSGPQGWAEEQIEKLIPKMKG